MLDLPPAQVHCLAEVVYLEARGESELGRKAVAHVVLNRSKQRNKSVCEITREPKQFQVQFRKSYVGETWQSIYKLASSPGSDPTGGATSFKTVWSKAKWNLRFLKTIGNHMFYR